MILNTEYLWYTNFYLEQQRKTLKVSGRSDPGIFLIDSLFKLTDASDILKMQTLSNAYRNSKSRYDSLFPNTLFKNANNKAILDSLIKAKFNLPLEGEVVPNLPLTDKNGKKASLTDYIGNYVIVNFWATWCGPCIKEFPYENKLYQDYKDKNLIVVNVCVDSKNEQWKAVSKTRNLQTINLFLEPEKYKIIKRVFDINGLPKSILIDKDLRVLDNDFKRASLLTQNDLEGIVNGQRR
jgi:thiol-disulfide isomerase/thioredoxin